MRKIILLLLFNICIFHCISAAADFENKNIRCGKLKKHFKLCEIRTDMKDNQVEYILEKVIFRCDTKEFRILSVRGYNKFGNMVYTDNEPFTLQDVRKKNILYPVIKGSLGDTWFKYVCSS